MLSDHAAQNLRTTSIGVSIWPSCGRASATDRGVRLLGERPSSGQAQIVIVARTLGAPGASRRDHGRSGYPAQTVLRPAFFAGGQAGGVHLGIQGGQELLLAVLGTPAG